MKGFLKNTIMNEYVDNLKDYGTLQRFFQIFNLHCTLLQHGLFFYLPVFNLLIFKFHIFWEGHKFLRNLHHRFGLCSNSQIYGGDVAKFCGLLRIYKLYYVVYEWFLKVDKSLQLHCWKPLNRHTHRRTHGYQGRRRHSLNLRLSWQPLSIWTLNTILCPESERRKIHY